jgi:hypothetical protein
MCVNNKEKVHGGDCRVKRLKGQGEGGGGGGGGGGGVIQS